MPGLQLSSRCVVAVVILQVVSSQDTTCGNVRDFYKTESCCGNPNKVLAAMPPWSCSATGICDCERMVNTLAGVPGAMFPTAFCSDSKHVLPVGTRSAPIPVANDALGNANLLIDGQPGDINFPHGNLKVLASVGEINPQTGAMLTGVPDGNGAYLKDAKTVRFIYQSESYGPVSRQETFPFFVNSDHVGVTGSHIHYIDFDREALSTYMEAGAPANAVGMIKDSGEAVLKMYNLKRQEVGKRMEGSTPNPHHSNVDINGNYIVGSAIGLLKPAKADWLLQSLCSAHLEVRHQWGAGKGVQDNLFITNEEWIDYANADDAIGLPAHVLDLATHELWAVSSFTLGGFEKIVEVNTGTSEYVGFVPSGYNGNFGGTFPSLVAKRNAAYSRSDGKPYVYPQDIVPTRLYIGKKNTDKSGKSDSSDFLARNGFEYGANYGFATDCSLGTPGAGGRDSWHLNTATPGATVQGAFYKLRWKNTPGEVRDFSHDGAWEFQDAPDGAPAGWCFWNAAGKDKAGYKTEHVSPDPRGGSRVLQGSTAGYFGIYDFSAISNSLAGGFPTSIPATYTCLQPESDITNMIKLGGAGKYADGQDATVMPDNAQNPGKKTFEDIDGIEWLAGANGEDWIIIHEDGGNQFGERKFLAKVGSPMEYFFVAMSGGAKSSRVLAGVSGVEGVFKEPAAHEFSGATDLSGLLAKDAGGNFLLSAGDTTGKRRELEARTAINDKYIVVSLQAHTNWGGWTESFHPDAAGQILLYKPKLPVATR